MAEWMLQTGLENLALFNLPNGQDNAKAYQHAVQLCSQATGLREGQIAAQFFEMLGRDPLDDGFRSDRLAMLSTEELAYLGLRARRAFVLQ